MDIKQLENKGFAFLNTKKVNTEKRQIVVIGTARGGTSLVAGALHNLGVFTGDKSNPPVFEDVLLSNAFENNELETAKSIVKRYSDEHFVWAWKRPAALNYLDKVEQVIPNPFYIFIFKDIFAIANRNSISMQADIGKGLQNALTDYSKIVDFVSHTDKPTMLVSAEKALQNKESFVNALIELNKNIVDLSENSQKAIDFIMPNPKEYLDITRNTKSIGSIDLLSCTRVKGWAKNVHNENPVHIDILIAGELKLRFLANDLRNDLIAKNLSRNGLCGFDVDISNLGLEPGIEVEVKVESDINNLTKKVLHD